MSDKHNDLRLVSYKKGKRLNVLRFQRDLATNDKEDFDIMVSLLGILKESVRYVHFNKESFGSYLTE